MGLPWTQHEVKDKKQPRWTSRMMNLNGRTTAFRRRYFSIIKIFLMVVLMSGIYYVFASGSSRSKNHYGWQRLSKTAAADQDEVLVSSSSKDAGLLPTLTQAFTTDFETTDGNMVPSGPRGTLRSPINIFSTAALGATVFAIHELAQHDQAMIGLACSYAAANPDAAVRLLVLGRGKTSLAGLKEVHGLERDDCPLHVYDGRAPASENVHAYTLEVLRYLSRLRAVTVIYGDGDDHPKPSFMRAALSAHNMAWITPIVLQENEVANSAWMSSLDPRQLRSISDFRIDIHVDATTHLGFLEKLFQSLADLHIPLRDRQPHLTLTFDDRDPQAVLKAVSKLRETGWPTSAISLRHSYLKTDRTSMSGTDVIDGWMPIDSNHFLIHLPGDTQASPYMLHYALVTAAKHGVSDRLGPPLNVWAYALAPQAHNDNMQLALESISSYALYEESAPTFARPLMLDPNAFTYFHEHVRSRAGKGAKLGSLNEELRTWVNLEDRRLLLAPVTPAGAFAKKLSSMAKPASSADTHASFDDISTLQSIGSNTPLIKTALWHNAIIQPQSFLLPLFDSEGNLVQQSIMS
ncbi:hypothetical protein PYCC9005_005539 [Savitreella phatthalungensis]